MQQLISLEDVVQFFKLFSGYEFTVFLYMGLAIMPILMLYIKERKCKILSRTGVKIKKLKKIEAKGLASFALFIVLSISFSSIEQNDAIESATKVIDFVASFIILIWTKTCAYNKLIK